MNRFFKIVALSSAVVFPNMGLAESDRFDDWFAYSLSSVCTISADSSNGTSLMIVAIANGPQLAKFSNESWRSAPGSWSPDGSSLVHLNFSQFDNQSAIGLESEGGFVLADLDNSKGLAMLTIGLIAESVFDGWVEVNVQGAPSIGRFSARGYSDAISRYYRCIEDQA